MSFSFGFYNAIDDDRMYDATQMSMIFDGIIEDGVYMNIGDALMVVENDGMIVNVGTGRAWFNHTWNYNDSDMPLMISQSDLLLDRIDTIILDINSSEFSRTNEIKILQGTPSDKPAATTLVKTNEHWQYPLARILVKANSNTITQAEITNCVGTTECPFVKCPLETVSTDTLIIQWESQFETWFNRMKNQLSTDAAGNLQMQLDSVDDQLDAVNNQLNGFSFGVTEDGKPGYKLEGADTVTPFKNISDAPSLTTYFRNDTDGYRSYEPFRFQCPSNTKILISANMTCSSASDGNGMSVDIYNASEGKWVNISSVSQGGTNKTVNYTLDSGDIYRIMTIYSGKGSSNITGTINVSVKFVDS